MSASLKVDGELKYDENAKIDITGLESVKLTIDGYYIVEYEASAGDVDIIKSFE